MLCGYPNDDNVVITIRGIGQMMPSNPGSKVTLSGELDEHTCRARSWISPRPAGIRMYGMRWTRLLTM